MRKSTQLFFIFLGLSMVLFFSGCGKSKAPINTEPEPVTPQKFDSAEFESPEKCKYCHFEIYGQWTRSVHANSAVNPVFLAEAVRTSRETEGASDFFCAGCHVPIGSMADEIPPFDGTRLSNVSKSGISCDFCHTVTEASGVGNASYRVSPGKIKYGPFDDPLHNPIHESEYARLFTESKYCGMCHDITHPQNGLVLAATYSEWKDSSFETKGVKCQDCHMTPGPGVTKPNPGVAATGAHKKREQIWTHDIIGSAEENLKSAATLFLGLPETAKLGQPISINVRIRNSGAGHYLPTGLTLFKEMWLEIIVTNQQGQVIYSSGVLDGKGDIPTGSKVFRTVLADADGRVTTNLWQAVSILSDRRIPPQQYVDEFFDIPGISSGGTVNIQARLLYRSISQARANQLPGSGTAVPVVEMAKITGKIPAK